MCLWNSTVVCRKYSFQQICRAIFWSLTQADGCRFLAAKAVLSGVECGSELYCFLSQGLPLALFIASTPHVMSGANITLMVDWALNTKLLSCRSACPDITVMDDWSLNTKLLSGRSPRPNISVKWLTGR